MWSATIPQASEWFLQAAHQKHYAAFNGIGYLYVKGRRVTDGKNHTKVTRAVQTYSAITIC